MKNDENIPSAGGPPPDSPRGNTRLPRKVTAALLVVSSLALSGVAALLLTGRAPASSGVGAVPAQSPCDSHHRVTASSKDSPWHSWPPARQVVGPPGGASQAAPKPAPETEGKPEARVHPAKRAVEAPAATPEELRIESLRKSEQQGPAAVRQILMDPKRSSTVKLAVLEKLRSAPPEEAVPVLVAFLGSPGGPSAAYMKPSAVRLLADLKHPLADEALAHLSRTSSDEEVRLTIAAVRAKETTR